MIPYLNMNARITIGRVVFERIHSFTIEETVKELGDTATIVVAREYRALKGKNVLEYLAAGDPVTIEAGYNGKFFEEFTGYVRMIEAEKPLVIHCDDHWYPLKQNAWTKAYAQVKLKRLLQDIAPGYTIECPDVALGKLELTSTSTYRVLAQIQQNYGLYARLRGKTINVGLSWDWEPGHTAQHRYHEQRNVRDSSNLKWRRKEDYNLKVRVEYPGADRKKKHVEVGVSTNDCHVKRVHYGGSSEREAKQLGESVLNRFSYDGYEGSITGFGTPRTHAGDTLLIENDINPERAGAYLAEGVKITFSPGGFSRENQLAYKVN